MVCKGLRLVKGRHLNGLRIFGVMGASIVVKECEQNTAWIHEIYERREKKVKKILADNGTFTKIQEFNHPTFSKEYFAGIFCGL